MSFRTVHDSGGAMEDSIEVIESFQKKSLASSAALIA
jgi:hypothetical protein